MAPVPSRLDAERDREMVVPVPIGPTSTIWEVLEDGRVWSRDVLHFASATDDTIVETWRYDDAGRLCHHYVYDRGRLVRGEEYMPDGTLHRSIDNDLRGEE